MTTFSEQALVFTGASVLLVPLFHRFGFGSVLGYLIAGVSIGPFGLRLIEDSESIRRFSELGVVMLLFVIGLEIQPRKLWSLRRHLYGLGGMQILFCSLIFMAIGWNQGLPLLSAGVLGFGLSLSSTAFAIQTLKEKNQLNTEFGRSSFAVLLMQDLVAIPALAIIPILGSAERTGDHALPSAGLAVGIIVLLVVASRYLMRPVFRAIASTRSREIFTATTLFIVLGIEVLMQKAGLSAALGTFLAGVLLADSEYRHEIEADLEPFKSLLMGLFFIAVGMGVGLDLIFARPVFMFLMAFGYLGVKGIASYASGRIFGMNHDNSKNMSISIVQGGEFAFVIFGMVLQLKLAPSETIATLIVVITLSMALSPVISFISERIAQFVQAKRKTEPKYDEIKDESPEVIIAGFGRFGQIFGRILRAQNIPFVAIDHDSDHIELVRKFGSKVYYGDASRQDILEAAGAAKAKYLILAIDNVEASVQAAQIITEHFPKIKVFARARNRGHVFELMNLGIKMIKRETFDSSAYFVRDLLIDMGFEAARANLVVEKFRTHDEIMLTEQFKVRDDDKRFVSLSKQGTAQLAQVLSEDSMKTNIAR